MTDEKEGETIPNITKKLIIYKKQKIYIIFIICVSVLFIGAFSVQKIQVKEQM